MVIKGDVQDVGFRDILLYDGRLYNLQGYGFNDRDGTVKAVIRGDNGSIDKFFNELRNVSEKKGIKITNISQEEIFEENIPLPEFSILSTDELSDINRKMGKGIDLLTLLVQGQNQIIQGQNQIIKILDEHTTLLQKMVDK